MKEVVIRISDTTYDAIIHRYYISEPKGLLKTLVDAVKKGQALPKRHGRLIDADKVENITWQEPYYHDALNVLTEVRDKVRELPTIIEADKEGGK